MKTIIITIAIIMMAPAFCLAGMTFNPVLAKDPIDTAKKWAEYRAQQLANQQAAISISGQEFISFDEYARIIYVRATIDSSESVDSMYNTPLDLSFVVGKTPGQLQAIAYQYIKNHPEKWQYPAPMLILIAIKLAFPGGNHVGEVR